MNPIDLDLVLDLYKQGNTSSDIADILQITRNEAINLVERVAKRLGLSSRTGLALYLQVQRVNDNEQRRRINSGG